MNGHIIHATKLSTDIDRLQVVAENQFLSKNDLRVFIFLCCRIGSQHYTRVDVKQTAQSLDLKKSQVEECLDNLIENDIIEEGGDDHVKSGYRMCYTAGQFRV